MILPTVESLFCGGGGGEDGMSKGSVRGNGEYDDRKR